MTVLENKILEAIERRQLAPLPSYVFFSRRSVFWCLAAVSIGLGAVSFAVLLFAVSDYYASRWRVFDNLPLNDVILSIPVFWLVSIPFFMASAYYGVRNTRRGYRYRAAHVIALCLVASIGLGALLHLFEAGRMANNLLAANFASYRQALDVPFDKWSRPSEGYLGGHADTLIDKSTLRLTDFHAKAWVVDLSQATNKLDTPILEEGDVAIRGVITGPTTFRAETIESFD
jgi:hypothetical protein